MKLERKLENGWVIVVENDTTPIVLEREDNKNHSNVLIWAYNPQIVHYKHIPNSGLTSYHKKGYRNKESLKLPTGFMWMGVEVLEERLNKLK
jgi:hypothetical protein